MVSTYSSGTTIPHTVLPNILDSNINQDVLTFIDFLPQCRQRSTYFTRGVYETFSPLVNRVNDWLRANPHWEIKTCESVVLKEEETGTISEDVTYTELGKGPTTFMSGLRLWITKSTSNRGVGQQIGYLNLMPRKIRERGMCSTTAYESLDEVINRYNTFIKTKPIPGRIITIQTLKMLVTIPGETHPDITCWIERGEFEKSYLYFLRIFYEITETYPEEIGIKDFIPNMLDAGGCCVVAEYERFHVLVNKASHWCSQQTDVRICNMQTVEIRGKKGRDLDTKKANFILSGIWMTFYARILRVAYAKSPETIRLNCNLITQLTSKTFVPVQTVGGNINRPKYETLSQTKARISAWIRATGAQVVHVETSNRTVKGSVENKYGHEGTITYYQSGVSKFRIYHVIVYMNGLYPEPPMESLPPVPEIADKTCTIL